jgi:hypothetical protein
MFYGGLDLVQKTGVNTDRTLYIMWGSGRGLGPGIPEFFGPCEMGTRR